MSVDMSVASFPHPVDIAVGRNIRKWRRLCGLSQKQVAERVGVSMQQLQKYETAVNRISASRLVEIANVLQVPPAELLAATGCYEAVGMDQYNRAEALVEILSGVSDSTLNLLMAMLHQISSERENSGTEVSINSSPLQ
ncbi:helix-turn-helix domain-containing protein [Paracoccus denitrificans]|uniref:helix-turn-helix domain-containing protein n=1 Tax=Paracoccus denitrificans TaxID=266 RepID=UPI001F20B8D1|nr:helix-turn-helix transcriptional regulator [Paracoccus denitrificans]